MNSPKCFYSFINCILNIFLTCHIAFNAHNSFFQFILQQFKSLLIHVSNSYFAASCMQISDCLFS